MREVRGTRPMLKGSEVSKRSKRKHKRKERRGEEGDILRNR